MVEKKFFECDQQDMNVSLKNVLLTEQMLNDHLLKALSLIEKGKQKC